MLLLVMTPGHTFPGAVHPFGMVQLSPDTRKDNWDACCGYHYSALSSLDSRIPLSGTESVIMEIFVMPGTGELNKAW
jgi:putative alpha-1,2-mannosidase